MHRVPQSNKLYGEAQGGRKEGEEYGLSISVIGANAYRAP